MTTQFTAELSRTLREVLLWLERANEPDDESQTNEQYRLLLIDRLREALEAS